MQLMMGNDLLTSAASTSHVHLHSILDHNDAIVILPPSITTLDAIVKDIRLVHKVDSNGNSLVPADSSARIST